MRSPVDYSRTDSTVLNRLSVSDLKVVLVGAGALGNEVFKTLGLLGVGEVMIVDPDWIEPSNFSRSVFFRETNQKMKAEALCEAGNQWFPDTHWTCACHEIADLGYRDLLPYQALLGCVDNDLARIEISIISKRLNLPYIDGALGGSDYWRGRVTLFPAIGPCFGCKLMPTRRQQLIRMMDASYRPCWTVCEQSAIPSTPVMSSITAAMQVDLGLKYVLGVSSSADTNRSMSVEISLQDLPKIDTISMSHSVDCPFHSSHQANLRPALDDHQQVRDLIGTYGGERIELDWPVCVKARCQLCHTNWQPMRRTAWLRRHGVCPSCQGRQFIELENLRYISFHSEWASKTVTSLGLPPRHLYSII
jgi:hypothetical protein